MLQLIIMLICLVALCAICLKYTNCSLASPQFAFSACFVPAVLYAFFFVKYWSLDFSAKTVLTIVGGCALFVGVSFLISFVLDKKGGKRFSVASPLQQPCEIYCKKLNLILFVIFQIITLLWTVAFLIKVYGQFDLTGAIAHFNDTNKFSDQIIELPGILGKFRILSLASGYVFSYILLHSVINKYKSHYILLASNIALCFINSVITGSRTDAFQLFAAIVVVAYFIYAKRYGFKMKITLKTGALFVGCSLLLVLSFQFVGNLLGRGSTINLFEYIGIYLSAPLKNLDIFIRAGKFGAPVSRWQTLIAVVNVIGNRFGMPHLVHKFDLPFNTVNGHDLGNVATTFYAYLYDGGVLGVIIFITIMAVICQLIYRYAASDKNKNGISISVIVYSYVFFTIAFSFFSNKFYEHIFSGYFVYLIVFWWLLKLYVEWFSIENCKKLINKIKKSR